MTSLAVIVFIFVYLGMALGRAPDLRLDRTGVALLGLIALLATGELSLEEAGRAVDAPWRCSLLLAGPRCHIIVAERTATAGARLSFVVFARSGIPMTLGSLAATAAWLIFTGLVGW